MSDSGHHDLKKVRGIGNATEEGLSKIGISTVSQMIQKLNQIFKEVNNDADLAYREYKKLILYDANVELPFVWLKASFNHLVKKREEYYAILADEASQDKEEILEKKEETGIEDILDKPLRDITYISEEVAATLEEIKIERVYQTLTKFFKFSEVLIDNHSKATVVQKERTYTFLYNVARWCDMGLKPSLEDINTMNNPDKAEGNGVEEDLQSLSLDAPAEGDSTDGPHTNSEPVVPEIEGSPASRDGGDNIAVPLNKHVAK